MDKMMLLRGDSLIVNSNLSIRHPSLNDIVEFGEDRYEKAISLFITKPYDKMVDLYDMGKDFDDFVPYDIFIMMFASDDFHEEIKWLTGFDFQTYKNFENDDFYLYNDQSDVFIDRLSYQLISDYLYELNFIPRKSEFNPAKGKAREFLIQQKREEIKYNSLKSKKNFLSNLVSAVAFNGDSNINIFNVWELKLYQFYNCIHRIRIRDNYKNTMYGIYSGSIDQSKIEFETIDWTKEI